MMHMLRRLALLPLVALAISSCSSSEDDKVKVDTKVGDIRTNEVWKDGLKLTGVIRIFEGATVEIEPGAKITCSESVLIQVGGAIRVESSNEHASIACPRWRGIQVAQNGRLDIDGLDIENAEVGYETTKGAGTVNITNASILATVRPFLVGAGSTMNLTRVKATTPTQLGEFEVSVSEVFGKLIAKFLDYEANTNEGIMVQKGGEAEIEDSVLKAKNGLDLVSMYGGTSLKLSYSTLRGAHCGPHLGVSKDEEKRPPGRLEIDHVTSEDNIYGITIYAASVEGPHIIKDSNFAGTAAWLDLQGDHGPITFENVFTTGEETILRTDPPTITRAPARIEGAGPRGSF
ncbi:MAG: hypothetical protein BGO98_39125 [Myxococcales bacterium 68-20]|nr:MAG: hypothetical protein BGO98_39125 [Myxococcales bacterium 68-20]